MTGQDGASIDSAIDDMYEDAAFYGVTPRAASDEETRETRAWLDAYFPEDEP